jgi:hypothetical protein
MKKIFNIFNIKKIKFIGISILTYYTFKKNIFKTEEKTDEYYFKLYTEFIKKNQAMDFIKISEQNPKNMFLQLISAILQLLEGKTEKVFEINYFIHEYPKNKKLSPEFNYLLFIACNVVGQKDKAISFCEKAANMGILDAKIELVRKYLFYLNEGIQL